MTPSDAARRITAARKKFGVIRMAIPGGESTLNRVWLIGYVRLRGVSGSIGPTEFGYRTDRD